MGLFSNLRAAAMSGRSPSDDIARALLAMPLMVAASDGEINEAELHQLVNMYAFNPIFQALGVKRTMDLMQDNVRTLRAKGAEHLFVASLAALPQPLRETALCFAVRTALADGSLAAAESTMLTTMAIRMDVPPETSGKICEVVGMLQRARA
jgi:tellurite resistance protein